MNLIEIILALRGKNTVERAHIMHNMGCDAKSADTINRCFDDAGQLIDYDGKPIQNVVNMDMPTTPELGQPYLTEVCQNPDGMTAATFQVPLPTDDMDGNCLTIKITSEGILIDHVREDEVVGTFGQTFDEIAENLCDGVADPNNDMFVCVSCRQASDIEDSVKRGGELYCVNCAKD